MKETLTTTDVAKLLGLHANTLKNWVREGKLPSFRTLGGHYRIRINELVNSLKEHGIPVPDELKKHSKHVFVVHPEKNIREELMKELNSVDGVESEEFESGVDALLAMGCSMPDVVVWYCGHNDVDPKAMIKGISSKSSPARTGIMMIKDFDDEIPSDNIADSPGIHLLSHSTSVVDIVKKIREF
ncbi:MAG TPA: helix-turn-helix domain-containing protein [bacterium]|nr:helix-turn-helix domain-containing protein [bacterium]